MPKLTCPCGYLHNLTAMPDDGWITIRDRDYEELLQSEREYRDGAKHLATRIVELCGKLYECPNCGRILWEKAGGGGNYLAFQPDDA